MDFTGKTKQTNYRLAFAFGIALNLIYVGVESYTGARVGSSALIADAGHNLTDVLSLIISWIAIGLAKLRPFGQFTYGLRKTTILASTINGVLIIVAAAFILLEAIKKVRHPSPVPGDIIMIVASIGIVINALTAFLFMKGKKKDLNIKGTFLHMTSDAAVSAGVVIGGFFMKNSGSLWIDPALSFLITGVILWSAVGLLIDSFRLSVDAVPKGIDIEKVRSFLKGNEGIIDVHDLHIWALSTTEIALTAHLVAHEHYENSKISEISMNLQKEFNINHSTLQIECNEKMFRQFSKKQPGLHLK